MRRSSIRRLLALTALVLAAGSCKNEPIGPTSGNVFLELAGPLPARSVQLLFIGKATAVTAIGSVRVFVSQPFGDTVNIIAIAPAGQSLLSGAFATVTVPDIGAGTASKTAIVSVAAPDYQLRDSTAYSIRIHPPVD